MTTEKINRNDPCPCGSGKKYKRCCMLRDKAEQAERAAWEQAARNMRTALIGFAKERDFVQDLGIALGLFWQDRYAIDTVHMMSVDESLRFFDWFAHDYTLQHATTPAPDAEAQAPSPWQRAGRTLIQVYRHELADTLSDKEAETLDRWIASLPGSAFIVEGLDAEAGTVMLHDLLVDREVTVHDRAAATHGEPGQILLGRPLPEQDAVRLSGATVMLPAEEREGLVTSMEAAYQAYQEAQSQGEGETEGTTADGDRYVSFLHDRAYLLTHYALEWADRENRPAVASEDPEARRPGAKAVQQVIRWRQGRTEIRQ